MSSKIYVDIPSKSEVYEVTKGCCYNVVYYGGPVFEVIGRKDDPYSKRLNSWDLECNCNSQLKMTFVNKEFYQHKYQMVMAWKTGQSGQSAVLN